MKPIKKRLVLHFPGFEPVDAEAHRKRYERSSLQSAEAFGFSVNTGPLEKGSEFPVFLVEAKGSNWLVETRIAVLDHNDYITSLRSLSFPLQLAKGYVAAFHVVLQGGLSGYLREAWRFALFFVFPFLLMSTILALSALIVTFPFLVALPAWHLVWTVPFAVVLCWKLFLPFAERYLTMHLFADWRMAVSVAQRDDPLLEKWIDAAVARVRQLIADPYDEVLITGHSMGASLAADVLGRLLQENPSIFKEKSVAFVTLGGAILQCALLKSASHLRSKVADIAKCPDIDWTEVQCLTDIVHFYKTKTVAACGYPDLRQAKLLLIRFKRMLTPEHYKKIKKDTLRVHRQYVLASDIRSNFDFALLTAGPIPASQFATFSDVAMPPISADGTLVA